MNLMNNDNIKVPYMRDLAHCLNKVMEMGYTENFKAEDGKLVSLETSRRYDPEEISVANFYRFEGVSDPDDNSILYAIETPDGAKGTLVDAYGAYSDPAVTKLMAKVPIKEKT